MRGCIHVWVPACVEVFVWREGRGKQLCVVSGVCRGMRAEKGVCEYWDGPRSRSYYNSDHVITLNNMW